MVTDEEMDRFVRENREIIERMMTDRGEDLRRMSVKAAELTRIRTEKFFSETFEAISDAEVQKHFMNAGLEFLAGISALMQIAPIPDYVKEAASETESNAKQAACKNNKDCPAKNKKSKPAKTASKERAE